MGLAPLCRSCGVREWGHLCSGRAPSEIERRALKAAKSKGRVNAVNAPVNAGKSARADMAAYMRKRRAALRALKATGSK